MANSHCNHCAKKKWCRAVYTDASPMGGGYATPSMLYSRKFTCRERRACIAVLEAKMVMEAIEHNAAEWRGMVLPVFKYGETVDISVHPLNLSSL